jgi:hypothetical protein
MDVWRCISSRSIFGGFARICSSFVYVHVFQLDPFDLCYFSSEAVAVPMRWSYVAITRRIFDYIIQPFFPGSGEGGAITASHLRLSSMLVEIVYGSGCNFYYF